MYLSILSKEEKRLFFELSVALSSIDGEYSDVERMMVESYCKEMDISYINDVVPELNQILTNISCVADEKTKRIMLFEAVGLVLVDGVYEKKEKDAIHKIETEFGIDSSYTEKCIGIISDYLSFQEKINKLVIG